MPDLLDLQNRHIRLKSSLPKDGEAEAFYFLTMIKTEQLGRLFVMKPAEITIKSPKITIKADAKLSLESPMSELNGTGVLTLSGGIIKIN